MDDLGSCLVILLLVDPHSLEGGERCEDGATEPHGVLALGGSQDLGLVGRRCQLVNLLPQTLAHALKERRASRKDDVLEEVLPHIVVALGN